MSIRSLARRLGLATFAAIGLSLGIGNAVAGLFPTYPVGTAPPDWTQDRYAPATFANAGTVFGRSNTLDLGLSAADGQASRLPQYASTFYNTQGRGQAINLSSYSVIYGSLYLPAAWATVNANDPLLNRRTDLWTVLSPATGTDVCPASNCNLFPYVGFSNASVSDPLNKGGTPRYRVFDTSVGAVDLPTPVVYDQWSDFCSVFTGSELRVFINGALAYTQTDLSQADTSYGPVTKFTRAITQGYNFGSTYTINWSGLGGGTLTAGAVAGGGGQTTPPGSPFALPLQVRATDAGGSALPCIPVTFAAPGSGASATLSATTVLTDRSGIAQVSATANATGGSYNVTATLPTGITVPIALTNFVAVPGTIVGNGAQATAVTTAFPQPLTATVRDTGGAPMAGVSVTFITPSSGATGSFPGNTHTATASTNASGVATSPVLTANGNTGTFQAEASTAGIVAPATYALTNLVGPAATIVPVTGSGQSTLINTPFGNELTARVRDASGNPVAAVSVTFTLPASGASGTFPGGVLTATVQTQALGYAVSPAITANARTGTFNAVASTAGVATGANFALTNLPRAASVVLASSGTPQTTLVLTAFGLPLVARVNDSTGAALPGITVTFTLPTTGASGTFAGGTTTVTATTNASGLATSPAITANGTAGAYSARASVAGVSGQAAFALTNTEPPPRVLSVSGGGNQSTTIDTSFGAPLSATVVDSLGTPVAGVSVTFILPSSGPSASFLAARATRSAAGPLTAVAQTNALGVAVSPSIVANGIPGTFTATATAPNVAAPVSYSLTNLAAGPPNPQQPIPTLSEWALILLVALLAGAGMLAQRKRPARARHH